MCIHAKLLICDDVFLVAQRLMWSSPNHGVRRNESLLRNNVWTKFVDGVPALSDLKRISKCGRRKYSGSQEIPRVLNGMGISIISTSKGLMTGHQAKKDKVGGEIIAFVW
jgi:small subunit ribosomal protein S8